MNNNTDNKHVPKTKEEKEASKALKMLEKQKRKDKSLQKTSNNNETTLATSVDNMSISDEPKKTENVQNVSKKLTSAEPTVKHSLPIVKSTKKEEKILVKEEKIKNFKRQFYPDVEKIIPVNISSDSKLHPEMIKYGLEINSFTTRGSTSRCQSFLIALKHMINDLPVNSNEYFFDTFTQSLDHSIEFLEKCRPLPVTIFTAINNLKSFFTVKEPDHEKNRREIIEFIDRFLTERIDMAHKNIENLVWKSINSNTTILVTSYSQIVVKSLIHCWSQIQLEQTTDENTSLFRVFVVSSFPDTNSTTMIDELTSHGVPVCLINMSSVSQILPQIDVVIIGAHSVLFNSNVVTSSGSLSIVNMAKSFSKSVIVCCESFKFDNKNQFKFHNCKEMANTDSMIEQLCQYSLNTVAVKRLKNCRDVNSNITSLDLLYDVIPSKMITSIYCEFGKVSPTAVSSVLHMKHP